EEAQAKAAAERRGRGEGRAEGAGERRVAGAGGGRARGGGRGGGGRGGGGGGRPPDGGGGGGGGRPPARSAGARRGRGRPPATGRYCGPGAEGHDLGAHAHLRLPLASAEGAVKLAEASEAAEELLPEAVGLVQELKAAVGEAQNDRRLVVALLEVRGPREGPKDRTDAEGRAVLLAEPSADDQFRQAFRDWGLDVDGTPTEQAAARLAGHPRQVVTEVIAALDEWASERRRQKPPGDWRRLDGLAQALDDA